MADEIDLTDNPVRVLKAILAQRGVEVDPERAAELVRLERYCDEPVEEGQ